MNTQIIKTILIGCVFNIYWYIAVAGQNHYLWILVVLAMIAMLGTTVKQAIAILGMAIIGLLMELMLVMTSFIQFSGALLPWWLVMLWCVFSRYWCWLSLNFSFRVSILCLLGMILGPLSYITGRWLNAVDFTISLRLLAILSLCWGMYLPLSYQLYRRLFRR